jgi:DNA helicase-2/ATP-dependent DNA helicase PcrA
MNEFVRDFAIKEVVKLEQNYRSQGFILDAANAIIAQNKARLGKNLWTEAGKGEPALYVGRTTTRRRFIVDGEEPASRGDESPTWRCCIARMRSRAS